MNPLRKVIIFGGTHGNEWTGVYAIKKYAESLKIEFPNLELQFIHANPEAFRLNKRFKDEDLNRAFQYIQEDRPDSYEHKQAKMLKDLIDQEDCFVLDLHTTTSNMGNTVIISHNQPLNFHVALELVNNLSDTRVIVSPDPQKKYLASQSELGMMIEVGPVPNGVVDAKALSGTVALIKEVLRALSTPINLTGRSLEIYEEVEDIYYPQDNDGEITAIIDSNFQGTDFKAVNGEYWPLTTFEGKKLKMRTDEEMYPIFINEAAYYPTKLAYTLCRRRTIKP